MKNYMVMHWRIKNYEKIDNKPYSNYRYTFHWKPWYHPCQLLKEIFSRKNRTH